MEAWAPGSPDIEAWRERLAAAHTLVAEDVGRELGGLSRRDDGYIAFMFTSPAAARRGVAATLYGQTKVPPWPLSVHGAALPRPA